MFRKFDILRQIPPVAIASFFFLAATMGTRPIVPLHALNLDIGPEEIGLLVALYSLIPLVLATVIGFWLDTNDSRRVLFMGIGVTCVGLALPVLIGGWLGIYASQLITGSGFTAFILAAQKYSGAQATTAWERERSIAIFSMGVATGSLFGPLLAGVLGDWLGYEMAFLAMGGLALMAVVPLTRAPSSIPERDRAAENEPTPPRNPLKVFGYHPYMGRAFLISALILMAKDMYVAYFPLYADGIGLSATLVGVIIGINNGGGVIARIFQLSLLRRFGKNRVVVGSILLSGIFFLPIPLTENLWLLIVLSFIIGLGLGLGQPLSISTTISLSPPAKVGEVLGVRLTFNRLTQVVTPLGFGGLVLLTGVGGIFWFIGGLLTAGCTRLWIPDSAAEEQARPES